MMSPDPIHRQSHDSCTTSRHPSQQIERSITELAHTDWDLVTLLFQKAGQSGLEVRSLVLTEYIPTTDGCTRSAQDVKFRHPSATATLGPKLILIQNPMPSSATSVIFSCHGATIDSSQRVSSALLSTSSGCQPKLGFL